MNGKEAQRAAELGKVMSNPMRLELLWFVAKKKRAAAVDFARAQRESLGVASYHVSVLAGDGCIEEVGVEQVRGARRHDYAVTRRGLAVLKLVAEIGEKPVD